MTNNSLISPTKYPVSDKFVHFLILSVASVAVYFNTLKNGFVWDDTIYLVGNSNYKSFDLSRIFYAWGNGVEYLPVRDISYIIDYALWGEYPFGFHLTNIIIFALTVVVLYFFAIELHTHLLRNATKGENTATTSAPTSLALFTSLLFIVHPIQSQAVSFITCRNVLLSGLFYFLSLYVFLRFLEHTNQRFHLTYYLLSLLSFELALMSKATVITLPLILVLFIFFYYRKLTNDNRKRLLISVIPFFLLSAFFFLLFKKVATLAKIIRGDSYEFGIYNIWISIAKAVQIPFFYLYKIFVPKSLAAEYDIVFIKSLFNPSVVIAAIILVSIIWLAWRYKDVYPEFFFGWSWFILTLIPVLNFFPTKPVVADRYIFLPVFGIFFIVVFAWHIFLQNRFRTAIMIAGCVILLSLSYLTHEQNRIWKSDLTLWKDTVFKSPRLPNAYLNLGHTYLNMNDTTGAYSLFKKAQEIDPSRPDYEDTQGYFALKSKDDISAIQWFEAALRRKPGHLYALYHLGLLYERLGHYEKAIEYFNKITESPEYDLKGYQSTASFRINLFLFPKFEPELQKLRGILDRNPANDIVRERLADSLFKYGQYEDALTQYVMLEECGYRSASLFYHLGEIHRRKQELDKAVTMYTKSLSLDQSKCDTWNGLGVVYKQLKKFDLASRAFTRAIEVDPDCADVEFNLAVMYFDLGNKEKAFQQFTRINEKGLASSYNVEPYLRKIPD